MEYTQIISGFAAIIFVGIITYFAFRSKRKKEISENVIDEIRRVLWDKGATPTNFRMMSGWEGFKHFGLAAMPIAAYRDDYFVEVTATGENGKEEVHLTRIVLAFEKDVIETEWK
ncbi:MAG: hypothetical protein ACI85O_001525 [Saprospiraceae bacterium]|jgi:hypothetical protein